MTKREEKQIRQQLEAKLAELNGNVTRRDGLIAERAGDPMDVVQNRADLDLAVQFVNTDFQTKRAVELAIKALDDGDYAICRECSGDINPKRLAAIPWTTLCIHCQEEQDLSASELNKAA
jgi:DnaK suppressor protein